LDNDMLDRKLAAGELQPITGRRPGDLPFIAAALAHLARSERRSGGTDPGQGHRSGWRQAARVGSLRSGRWS
ncbi:MAG: hypothetical protein KDD11_12120, partial [Acidobacteria bacterium]|nr:hypothetical protein [Acidobacteriota bacterium]